MVPEGILRPQQTAQDAAALATVLRRRGKQLRLDGEKTAVLQGVTADAFLVVARDGRGVAVVLVPRETPGVTVDSTT